MNKFFDCPTEFKFSGNSGRFAGMAAVTGNVDSGGDVILPGAFKEFAKTRDGKLLLLYQHDPRSPIGKAVATENRSGLHVEGELMLDDPIAQRAYSQMKNGLIDSMSIGYSVLPGGEHFKADRRELSAIKVYEASVVTFGMNDRARIDSLKGALDCANPRELEDLLRDRLQIGKRKAAAGANKLWPILGNAELSDEARLEDEIERALNFKLSN